jgi:hypothetical protein
LRSPPFEFNYPSYAKATAILAKTGRRASIALGFEREQPLAAEDVS